MQAIERDKLLKAYEVVKTSRLTPEQHEAFAVIFDAFADFMEETTRPVAPVEGLERYGQNWHDEMEPKNEGDYVLFSQAEAIIAAKDAEAEKFADEIKEAAYEAWPEASDVGSDAPDIIRQLGQERNECLTEIEDLKNKLYRSEADNAALTARVKGLEHSELVKGVNTQYANALAYLEMTEDDDPEEFAKRIWDEREALETQLATARKALESADEALQSDALASAHAFIRAALEGEP